MVIKARAYARAWPMARKGLAVPAISPPRLNFAWLASLAALLALIPVLFVPVPGFVDAPAHMARHHILAWATSSDLLARRYLVHWQWIANMGEDIPAALLARWLGAEMATRLLSALIAPLTIAGMASLSRAAHGRIAAGALLASPLAFHQAWMYGFLNYGLGTALALLAAAWLYARRDEGWRSQALLGLVGLVVWTAHLVGWGILLLLAAGNELGRMSSPRDLMPAVRRNTPLLLPLIPLLLWRSHADNAALSLTYDSYFLTKLAVFLGIMRGTWMKLDFGLLAGIVVVAWLALRWASARRLEPRLLVSAALLAVVVLAAPDYLMDSWATDMRLAAVVMILLVLAIKPAADPRKERVIAMLGLSLFLLRLGSVTWAWSERSPLLEQRLRLLDAVPRGGRLGYVFVQPSCDTWRLQPDEKLASYAVNRRDAFVNTLFMVDNARLVTLRDQRLQARWTSDSQKVANACPARRYDPGALRAKLDAMRHDGFDAIWVSGVEREDMPPVPGYAVTRRLRNETVLLRR